MNIDVKNTVKPIDYIESMKILEKRVDNVINGKEDEFIWVLEHKPIYTAGTSSKSTDLLNKKINVVKSNRGGKHTYHGPGQKIVYFVLNLNKREKDIRMLLTKIEDCIINILQEYKIESFADKKNIGIWVNDKKKIKKIASIGIRVRKWVAYHGFAINVENDLSKFNEIIPCGIKDINITNLKSMGIKKFNGIERVIIKKFLNTFL